MYKEFWRILIKEYGGLKKALSIGALTVVGSLLEGFNIGLLIPLLENIGSTGDDGAHWISRAFASLFSALGAPFSLGSILLVLAILVLTIAVLKYLRLVLIERATADFTVWLRTKTMDNLLSADLQYFHHERLGALTDTLTTQSSRAGVSLSSVIDMVALLGLIVAYLIAAFLIAPLLATIAFGTALVLSFSMQYHIRRARVIGTELVERLNDFQSAGIENLSGIQVVKSFVLERLRWSDFNSKATTVGESEFLVGKNRSQMAVLQEMVLFGLIGTLVFVGVSVLDLGIAVIIALLFVLYRMMPRLSMFNTRRHQLTILMASMRNVKSVMLKTSSPTITSGATPFAGLQKGIEFKGVDFYYDSSPVVLKGNNFTIDAGKVTAIAGASGAGKSTLISLLLRFYDPSQGSILVDGVELTDLDLASWRGSIGVVSQDVFLFNDTVSYNIGLGRSGVSREAIETAAKRVYAHDFIQQLPNGYETVIGERGWNLSGGQRQRLALARAVLTDPKILILDEATSALDSESEQLIQRYLGEIRGTCTMVVVAHRLSTIQNADKILVLKNGEIVEEGNWESLLTKDGVLANYQKLQSWGNGSMNGPGASPSLDQPGPDATSVALPRIDSTR